MDLSAATVKDVSSVAALLPPASRLAAMMRAAAAPERPTIHPASFRTLARVLVADVPERVPAMDDVVFRTCETAFLEHRELRLGYSDAENRVTVRMVEPHGLLLRRTGWLLVTWDRDRDAARTLRLDRVFRAWLTELRFEPLDPRRLTERIVET